ncbi:hypothetical protein TKK_0009646 [Trichogramma kaykai]
MDKISQDDFKNSLEGAESFSTFTDVAEPLGLDDFELSTELESGLSDADKLKRVRRQLGLITLSWPEEKLDDPYLKGLPKQYRRVSDHEKALLWYAENFRQQFCIAYPERKPILLTCANECGVQKFVSTKIRRALLPHAELSTYERCTKFVGDFFKYIPLAQPVLLIKKICMKKETAINALSQDEDLRFIRLIHKTKLTT